MKLLVLLAVISVAVADALPFIIGGDPVKTPGKWPWQGSLQTDSGDHICGISLISDTWGVTAAHCVGEKGYQFRFGVNLYDYGGQLVGYKQIIKHKDYESGKGTFPNDIAVVEFNESVKFDETIQPIPMAESGAEHAGNVDCWITGWGITNVGGSWITLRLQEAKINVYTNKECIGDWGDSINAGHVCVGDYVNWKGSCNGDSGGPLVCKVDGRYELVGATSWGIDGCHPSLPSVYSRISYFREWIRRKTGV